MSLYLCQFPGCDYFTTVKSQIHEHHIQPRSANGSNKKFNKVYLCPTHHSKVFVPSAKRGIHSINGHDSIIILGWLRSTGGRVLAYDDGSGETQYSLERTSI